MTQTKVPDAGEAAVTLYARFESQEKLYLAHRPWYLPLHARGSGEVIEDEQLAPVNDPM